MKLFETKQIATIDAYTIQHEPITDKDLMVRASMTFVAEILNSGLRGKIVIFCGPGNNGGDGYVIAKILSDYKFEVEVYTLDLGKPMKGAVLFHYDQLVEQYKAKVKTIKSRCDYPDLQKVDLVIDALFGSGLTRLLKELPAELVNYINECNIPVWAVDIPSGLMGEQSANNDQVIIKAEKTITFQFPKISFLMPENNRFVGEFIVKDIGLHQDIINQLETNFSWLDDWEIKNSYKKRNKFSHKGTFGHALLIAGSYGKMGAAVLASEACLRAGVGLLTTHVPHNGAAIIQTAVPEAMLNIDPSDLMFTSVENIDQFDAIGIGPALGTKLNSKRGMEALLKEIKAPIVLDADALNLISQNPELLEVLPENSVLTPHPKEFKRLVGDAENRWEQIEQAIQFCKKHNVNVILKGAYTAVIDSSGHVFFNSTGNVGMATAGSGDVLCGIILGLLAQKYAPVDAARLGVFIHGRAADIAKGDKGVTALIASDIIDSLGAAFQKFE